MLNAIHTRRQVFLNAFVVLSAASILLITYRITAPPGLTWSHGGVDGAELALVSASLGIAHPPGYPLYTAVGWFFTHLANSPLAGMQWISHLSATAAALLLVIVLRQLNAAPRFSPAFALVVGFSYTLWTQAIIIEVYGLMIVLFAGCVVLWMRLQTGSPPKRGLTAFFAGHIFGLALTHHLTAILWLPGLIMLLPRRRLKVYLILLAGMITGLYPILILMLRAGAVPYANWGGIQNGLPALIDHLTARIYGQFAVEVTLAHALEGIIGAVVSIPQEFTLVGAAFALIGLYTLIRTRQWRWLLAAAAWWIAIGAFTGIYRAEDTITVYRLPLMFAAAVLIALGLHQVFGRLSGWAAVVFGMVLVASFYPAVTLRDDDQPRTYIQSIAAETPEDALIVTTSTRAVFTIWYYHFVEGIRPDWRIVDRNLWQFSWYRANLSQTYPDLPPTDDESLDRWLNQPELAQHPIIQETFSLPSGGRRMEQRLGWYFYLPAEVSP